MRTIKCPSCGSQGEFYVTATMTVGFMVFPRADGRTHRHGMHQFQPPKSVFVFCTECEYEWRSSNAQLMLDDYAGTDG